MDESGHMEIKVEFHMGIKVDTEIKWTRRSKWTTEIKVEFHMGIKVEKEIKVDNGDHNDEIKITHANFCMLQFRKTQFLVSRVFARISPSAVSIKPIQVFKF